MNTRASQLSIAALLLSSCGSSDSNLDHYSAELSDSIARVQEVVSMHHQQALDETDIGKLHDLEGRYANDVASRMGGMRDAQNSMRSCASCAASDTARPLQLCSATNDMGQIMGDATTEMSRHAHAMQAAVDVTAAHAEEEQHGSMMDALFENMLTGDTTIMDAMRAMMDQGASMMCPMHSHMHH